MNCKQGASNNSANKKNQPSTRYQKVEDTNVNKAKEIEEQLPAKLVALFSNVTFHRTAKEMTEKKKYEIKDDDENINFF